MPDLDLIAFDGDDTLWRSEDFYVDTEAALHRIVARHGAFDEVHLGEALARVERANIKLFGYGVKGMTLSMIETAITLTEGRIPARDIHEIVALGKQLLDHPIELLPAVRETVAALKPRHRLALITKGDLFHQEAKIARSGLADMFDRIEIVADKTPAVYARIFTGLDARADRAAMVGNSLPSDVLPVVELGGYGVHVPYRHTAHFERAAPIAHARVATIETLAELPAALARLA